jgi:hypothetical protein
MMGLPSENIDDDNDINDDHDDDVDKVDYNYDVDEIFNDIAYNNNYNNNNEYDICKVTSSSLLFSSLHRDTILY